METDLPGSIEVEYEPIFDGSQTSLSELRWKVGSQTLPGTSSLARPGHVLCPDKNHPASARALEARMPRSRLPWPRRSRPRSRSLPSDADVWLSYAVSGGAVLSSWLYDKLLLVGTLALWYVHPFPPLACNHMTIPGLYSTPPLIPTPRPYLSPTYDPLGPDPAAVWTAGGMGECILSLLFEPDTLSASVCGSADGQWSVFSAEVSDAWVGPVVGWVSECVLGAGDVYHGGPGCFLSLWYILECTCNA